MIISLDLVREVLKDALGRDSFIAGFITRVKEDSLHPSAGITKDGTLHYNPVFVKEHIQSKEDLFALILHETLHPAFSHFIHKNGELENLACDAIINAAISTLYSSESGRGRLFQRLYPPKGITALLRPESRLYESRFRRVYKSLYLRSSTTPKTTTGELIQTLKILAEGISFHCFLLGSHGDLARSGFSIPDEVSSRIASELQGHIQAKQAGYSDTLTEMLIEALRSKTSVRKAMLEKYSTRAKFDRFKELLRDRTRSVSPIPLCPSKRDLVLIASGIYPGYFHNQAMRSLRKNDRGLAIYLDVSGSVTNALPKIIGVLLPLKHSIRSIFQFSNKVVEVAFADLLRGKILTTGGTDFDCVARSILEKGFERAVIITDGYASLDDQLADELAKRNVAILTIIVDGRSCSELEPFGEVLKLEDIIE